MARLTCLGFGGSAAVSAAAATQAVTSSVFSLIARSVYNSDILAASLEVPNVKKDRRNFLKTAATGAAALAAGGAQAQAQQQTAQNGRISAPGAAAVQAEAGSVASSVEVLTSENPGSDFMVDVMQRLGFDYVCANPGSSFRGLHESVV